MSSFQAGGRNFWSVKIIWSFVRIMELLRKMKQKCRSCWEKSRKILSIFYHRLEKTTTRITIIKAKVFNSPGSTKLIKKISKYTKMECPNKLGRHVYLIGLVYYLPRVCKKTVDNCVSSVPMVSPFMSRVSNIESDNSQNGGLEDYNNISDRIFSHFTTPSIKISLG